MQWLRYARPHHPTLEELHADQVRQEVLKARVREAETRWQSIPLKTGSDAVVGSAAQQTASLEQMLANHRQKVEEGNRILDEDKRNIDINQLNAKNLKEQDGSVQTETPQATVEKLAKQRSNPSQEFKPVEWAPVSKR